MATQPKITNDKYFLQRIWYYASTMRRFFGTEPSWYPNIDFQAVNKSNIGVGIVVGVSARRYAVIPEWKRMSQAQLKPDCEPQYTTPDKVICGIDVEIAELLTYEHELVRRAIRDRIEVKGIP